MWGLIRIQTVCHSDGISEGTFRKVDLIPKKNQQTTKSMKNSPGQRVKGYYTYQSNGAISCAKAKQAPQQGEQHYFGNYNQ